MCAGTSFDKTLAARALTSLDTAVRPRLTEQGPHFEAHHPTFYVECRPTCKSKPRNNAAEIRSAEVLSQVVAERQGETRGSALLSEVEERLGRPLEANVLMGWALNRSSGVAAANSLVRARYLRGDKHDVVDAIIEELLLAEERTSLTDQSHDDGS